jgi:transposase
MDTSQQVTISSRSKEGSLAPQRQRRSIAEKRRVVEETLAPGSSVARVARANGINANQLFSWRRLYLAGRLGETKPGLQLLPVRVRERMPATVALEPPAGAAPRGTIHVEFRQAQVRIEGNADPGLVRVLLECLRG